MGTSLKWLILASFTNLIGNSVGTLIAVQRNLIAHLGSVPNASNILQDFLGLKGTALSAPLSFLLVQLVLTLLAFQPKWLGRVGIAGLTFVGLLYTLAQAGEPIVPRQFQPGGFDLVQSGILLVNLASSACMFVMGIKAWRTKHTSQPLALEAR